MRNFVALIALVLFSVNLLAQNEVSYGIKCGTLTYSVRSTTVLPGMPPLKVMAEGKSSFDEYGKKTATRYTETTDPGEAILKSTKHYFSLCLPDYYCLINTDSGEKIDEENLSGATKEMLERHSITDYDNLTGTEAGIFTSEYTGTIIYLGKTCKKYRITEKVPLYGNEDIVVVWNNIVLQRTSKTPYLKYEYTVVRIDESTPDTSLFTIP